MKKTLLLFSILISTLTFAQQESSENDELNRVKEDIISTDELSLKNTSLDNFKVFPNPTRNTLTVRLGDLSEAISFDIHDVLGKLVYNRKIVSFDLQKNSFKLDMSSFQEGIYMFSLKTKIASKTIRVVKL